MCSKENQRGQVIPIVALCLAALMGFAAFAVDLGYLRYQQRLQQSAADAAAIAAAWQLQNVTGSTASACGDPAQPGSPTSVCAAGQSASAKNGFTNNGPQTYVSVNYPPAAGAYAGDINAVQAMVYVRQRGFFSPIFGRTQNPVTTSATAIIRGNPNAPCIETRYGHMQINAGAVVNAPCGMLIATDLAASSAQTVNVPSIGAGGHIQCGPCTNATVQTPGILPFPDPCSTIPGCAALTALVATGNTPGPAPFSSCGAQPSGSSLTPGCYSSIGTGKGANSGTIDLAPGLYIVQGDVSVNGFTCSTCDDTDGVTLVVGGKTNMNQSTSSIHAPPAAQGIGSVQVTASGGAAGVLWYDTGASNCTNPSNGSSLSGTWVGMLYAPTCHFNINAGSTLTVNFLVVGEIESNGIVLTVPNTDQPGYPQTPVLAE